MNTTAKRFAFWCLLSFSALLSSASLRAQEPVISLERTACFGGTCPVYSLEIFEGGQVKYVGKDFVQVTGERRASVKRDAVKSLVSFFLRAKYFTLKSDYETCKNLQASDLPTTYSSLRVGARRKTVKDYFCGPKRLQELELEVDRATNSHQWIHGTKDDLKQWEIVGFDVGWRIKPGMNRFMQAAGNGDLIELARGHHSGIDVNAGDETGWTALMLASAMCQKQAVQQLLDWGSKVDLKDKNGDTALIGASAAFCSNEKSREWQASIVRMLLQRGANPNTQDSAGETALMAVTTYGNVSALQALLDAGAETQVKDNAGSSALDYAHTALRKYKDRFWTPELRELVALLEARQ